MISTLFLLAAQTTAIFDKSISAHSALKSATVDVSVTQKADSKTTSIRAKVSFIQPDRVLVRVTTKASGMVDASDRSYTVVKNKLYGYDHMTNEYLVRDVITRGPLATRLHSSIGQTDQAIRLLLDSSEMKNFLSRIKTVPGWTLTKNTAETIAKSSMPSFGNYAVRFAAANNRMLGARIVTDKSTVEWSYKYSSPPTAIAFTKPAKAIKVDTFRDRQKAPTFGDTQAKSLYEASVGAYRRAKSINYVVEDGSGKWAVSFSPSAIKQQLKATNVDWKAGSLTVVQSGRKQVVRCPASEVEHQLSQLKAPLEPTLRILVQGYNPAERLFTGLRLKSSGSVSFGGVTYHVLQATRSGYRLTVQIRGDTRLIASTVSEQLDSRGRSMQQTERRFSYR